MSEGDSRAAPYNPRDLRFFITGGFLSTLSAQMQSVAVGWQVYDLTSDPISLGYVGLSVFLPMAILMLPAGDLADRVDRRLIVIFSYIGQALCAGLFLGLTLAGTTDTWPFYVILALFGVSRAFVRPASQSFLPALAPPEKFATAVAWLSSAHQTATILGPALGGILYVFGPPIVYGACVVALLGMAGLVTAIRRHGQPPRGEQGAGAAKRLLAGIAYVRANKLVLGAITLDMFGVLLGGVAALLPVYARDILHVGPEGLGLLRTGPALGAAAVGLILTRVPITRAAGKAMLVCVGIFGVTAIVFGVSESFALSLAVLIVMGAADMISVYVRTTMIQLVTPDAMRGRVSAVNALFIGASNELGEFRAGMMAAWIGTVPAVVVGGVGTVIVVLLCAWRFPELRRVERLSDLRPPPLQR
jgi:MFS family permease